jgi:hypothetical protein
MANPAAILSVVVKAVGVKATNAQLAGTSTALKSTNAQAVGAGKAMTTAGAASTKASKRMSAASKTASTGFLTAAKHAGGLVAAYASIKGLEKSVHTTEDLGKTTLTLSKSFGLATHEASRWAAVAKARGTEGKALTMGFKSLATQTRSSAAASKYAGNAFQDLGISQKELRKHGDDLNWVLGRVSDGLKELPPGTNKAAIQAKLFGRTWTTLSPLVRDGSKAMNEQLGVADKYGATLSGKTVKGLRDTIVAQREAKLASIGLQVTLGQTLIPVIDKVIKAFATTVLAFRNGTGEAGRIRDAIGQVLAVLSPLGTSIQTIVRWLGEQQKQTKVLVPILAGLAVVLWAVNAALSANPIVLFVLALAALAVAVVTAYRESETFQKILDAIASWVTTAMPKVRAAFESAFGWLRDNIPVIIGAVVTAFHAFVGAIGTAVEWVRTATTNVRTEIGKWDVLFAVLGAAAVFVKTVFGPAFAVLQTVFRLGLAAIVAIAKGAWELVKGVFRGAWTALKAIVEGGLQVVRGVIKIIGGLFKGDFGQIWDGIKDIFTGGVHALAGIMKGAWDIIKGGLSGLKTSFLSFWSTLWDEIKKTFGGGVNILIDFVNAIISAINALPAIPNITKIAHVGFASGGVNEDRAPGGHFARGGAYARTRGLVSRPIVMMGEEAPRHPEYVIPTNPAYRGRAQALLKQAAGAIGFQAGGRWGVGELEDLWTSVNGPRDMRHTMAIISTAESGVPGQYGYQYAKNPSGATGLWQILGSLIPGDLMNAEVNARNAVAKLKLQGLGAWAASRSVWEPLLGKNLKDFIGGTAGAVAGGAADIVSGVLGNLPGVGDIPDWLKPLGTYALDKVKGWVGSVADNIIPGGGGGGGGGQATGTLKTAQKVASMFGLRISSTWRDPAHNRAVGGVEGSLHTHGSMSNPGAVDEVGPVGQMMAALAWVQSHLSLKEAMVHDVGSGLHLHMGFFEKGGIFEMLAKGGGPQKGGGPAKGLLPPPIHPAIPAFIDKLKTGATEKIRNTAINGMLSTIQGIGLPDSLTAMLTSLSGQSDLFGQNADMAGQLTDETAIRDLLQTELDKRVAGAPPDLLLQASKQAAATRGAWLTDKLFPGAEQQSMVEEALGRIGGSTQLEWLYSQLSSTLSWRNAILSAQTIVAEKRETIRQMIEATMARLEAWKARVIELTKARDRLQAQLDKLKERLKTLKDRLGTLDDSPKKNKESIRKTREQIEQVRAGIGAAQGDLHGTRMDLHDALDVRDGLSVALDAMTQQRETLASVSGGLFGDLQKAQGLTPDVTPYSEAPTLGTLGGAIFDTQMRIKDLTDKPIRVLADVPSTPDTAEPTVNLQDLLKATNVAFLLNQIPDLERAGLLAPYLRQFEEYSAVKVPADQLPFLGSFHTGGVAPFEGLAHVLRGETMIPPGVTNDLGVDFGPIEIYIGGEKIDERVDVRIRQKDREDRGQWQSGTLR